MTLQKVREENRTIKLKPALSCPSYLMCYHFDLATFPTMHKKKDENYLRFSLLELHLDFQTQMSLFRLARLELASQEKICLQVDYIFPAPLSFLPLENETVKFFWPFEGKLFQISR